MVRKLIIIVAAAVAFAVLADYAGIVKISVFDKKPGILKIRDEYVLKTPQNIETNAF